MADDQVFEIWDDEFLEKAIQLTEAAVSSSNPTQLPPPPPPQRLVPPLPPHSAPHISYSPPRELSQRVKEDYRTNFSHKSFDWPITLNGINPSLNDAPYCSRLAEADNDSKDEEIERLKKELGRVSKELTNMGQECSVLRKERDKTEKRLRSVLSHNESEDAEAPCPKKSNLKCKVSIQDHSIVRPRCEGLIPCKEVGVQTDEHAESSNLRIEKNLLSTYPSKKLAGIWEPPPPSDQQSRRNLISKLFVACEADFRILFECLGPNIPAKKTITKVDSSKHNWGDEAVDSTEAAKVSHLYFMLTMINYDAVRLEDLLEALVDLSSLRNMMIVHRSLCVLRVVLKHILSVENKSSNGDNIIIEDPSSVNSSDKHSEMGRFCENTSASPNLHHPVVTRLLSAKKIWKKDVLNDASSLLISPSKWVSLFQLMHLIITRNNEENIRLEAVSIMNILLLRTDAYVEREMYGEVPVFQNISQLLRKEAGLGVQKQAVHLLYLMLNCPNLMSMFCSSCKEEGTAAEAPTENNVPAFQGAILDGLADCLDCRGNVMQIILALKLRRKAIVLLAFLASSGRSGFEILLGYNHPIRTNFLYLIMQILASEIEIEASECTQPSDVFRERTLLIREALILLNRLASNLKYSAMVLRLLTNRRDMARLTIDIASRLSRIRQIRESEIMDLVRIFKKRVFTFLGDTVLEK